jgi:hypothetical protein
MKKYIACLLGLPRRQASLLDKVRIGYLLATSNDDDSTRVYEEAHHLKYVSSGELKRWKSQLHINLHKLMNKHPRTRRPPWHPPGDQDPGVADEKEQEEELMQPGDEE